MTGARSFVWIDLENTPHVLFLEPFLRGLQDDGWEVRVTAKPQSQTLALASVRGMRVEAIGGGDFVGPLRKVLGGGLRTLALTRWLRRQGGWPALLLSSSRSAALTALINRIPSVALLDYEHSATLPFVGSAAVWWPSVLEGAVPKAVRAVSRYYDGLKENLYLDTWDFDRESSRRELGIPGDCYLVVTRPPATTAHYSVDQSLEQWLAALRVVAGWDCAQVLVSFRSARQREELMPTLNLLQRVGVLDRVVPGPGLVAAADLVLGGGGTMNREAAVLGIPVWSAFCGATPHIDVMLEREGRLRWVRTAKELSAAVAAGRPARLEERRPRAMGFSAIYENVASHLNPRPVRKGLPGHSVGSEARN